MWRAALLLVFCSCAFRFGEDKLDIIETGTPLDARGQPFLPWLLRDVHLAVGKEGAPWLAAVAKPESPYADSSDSSQLIKGALKLYRISVPASLEPEFVSPEQTSFFPPPPSQSICAYRPDGRSSFFVSIRRPDEPSTIEFPTGDALPPDLFCGQRTLAFFAATLEKPIDIVRRQSDGSLWHTQMPWPLGARRELGQGPTGFDDREEVLFAVDGNYRTIAYYLDSLEQVDLGVLYWGQSRNGRFISLDLDGNMQVFFIPERLRQPVGFRLGPEGRILGIDEARAEILTCDFDGLRAVALPQPGQPSPRIAPQRILDAAPCAANSLQLPALTSVLLYSPATDPPGKELRAVRLDQPELGPRSLFRAPGERILGICQDRAVAYSLDPVDRYGPSVSDGWFASQRFMERGREVRFSPECRRVYFKEYAANVRKLGELRSMALLPDGTADLVSLSRLLRNVGFYRVLKDGRLLAAANLGVVGIENRLFLLDEKTGEAQALFHSINAVTGMLPLDAFLPGRDELILEVKDSEPGRQSGLLVLRLPPRKTL